MHAASPEKLRDESAPGALAASLDATAVKRGARKAVEDWTGTATDIEQSTSMEAQWSRYTARFAYVGDLTLSETCTTIREIMAEVSSARPEGQRPWHHAEPRADDSPAPLNENGTRGKGHGSSRPSSRAAEAAIRQLEAERRYIERTLRA